MLTSNQFSVNNENLSLNCTMSSPLVKKKFQTKEKLKPERRTSNTNDTREKLSGSKLRVMSISPIGKKISLSSSFLSCESFFAGGNLTKSKPNPNLGDTIQTKNSFPSAFLKDLETKMTNHPLLPVDKTNDEVFKHVLICTKLKRPEMPRFNSDFCKKRLYHELSKILFHFSPNTQVGTISL